MAYTKLGKTDINVSRLCLGCMSFGDAASNFHDWTLNFEDSNNIIKRALDAGINFFDTANVYSAGTSEEYLGRALKCVPRSEIVIASKVYFNEGHLSKQAIAREIEGTLKRLGTEYLDLYIIHRFDYSTPIEETMEALDMLVKSGKVRALGASAIYSYQFSDMQITAQQNGWTMFSAMQNHYNLLYREDERELIPKCEQFNVSRTPYSPLASGRLARIEWKTDSHRSRTDKTASAKYDSAQDTDSKIVVRVKELAEKYGASMSQIALSWQFAKGVASPIIGVSKMSHLDDALGALEVKLTQDDCNYLEELYVPHEVVGALSKV